MSTIIRERMAAECDGEFVVFLIGMRINHFWKIWRWLPVFTAMGRMLRELSARPAMGLLHARGQFGLRNQWLVQYWRDFDSLDAYAHAKDAQHVPAMAAFFRAIGDNGDVGIWHETYVIRAGSYESIYANMPPHGLGLAGRLVPARGARAKARGRMAASGPG